MGLSAAGALLLGLTTATSATAAAAPRYIFELDWIECIDQTGVTNRGSDEIFAKVIYGSQTMYTRPMPDTDVGEVKMFDHYSRTIAPRIVHVNNSNLGFLNFETGDAWSVDRTGVPGPFPSFSVALYDKDVGSMQGGSHTHIDTQTISFTQAQLAADLPSLGRSKAYTYKFENLTADYNVRIAVHRVA